MKDKYYNDYTLDVGQNSDPNYSSYKLSKHEFDLYDDSKANPSPVIRIKRSNTATKGERWKVSKDNELIFIIEGSKISKKEREFLRTPEGMTFLTNQIKLNAQITFGKIRIELKKFLNKQSK